MADGWHLKLKLKGDTDLVVTKIAIGAGGTSGWHTHPGSSLVKVTAGTVTLYDADPCTGRQLGVGGTFVDEGGGHLHLVRNETGVAAEVSVVQIMPAGLPRRIDAPRPNNCAADVQ
jgi:quercetin dioxygenase-like cupin family protein